MTRLVLWAQASTTGGSGPAPPPLSQPTADPAVALLSMRRWFTTTTLGPPDGTPVLSYLLLCWLVALGVLVLLALAFQGPKRLLFQIFDIRGHFRLLAQSVDRIRGTGRLVAITVGVAVLTWTLSQAVWFRMDVTASTDLATLTKGRALTELAGEHAVLAGWSPLRDLASLSDTILLSVLTAGIAFNFAASRWSLGAADSAFADDGYGTDDLLGIVGREAAGLGTWASLAWVATILYAVYQVSTALIRTGDLPLGGAIVLEAFVIPVLVLIADATLMAWVLVELRNARLGARAAERFDIAGAVSLVPASLVACLAALPARYGALGLFLILPYAKLTGGVGLAWTTASIQAGSLAFLGLVGAAAWTRTSFFGTFSVFGRMLRQEGGHLVVATAAISGLAALTTAPAYFLLLSLPAQHWLLAAADSYAHYATLLVGLFGLSALVELASRALPVARMAS